MTSRFPVGTALAVLGGLFYTIFLFSPFTGAACGVSLVMDGWQFLVFGLEMAYSDLFYGRPSMMGVLLLVVYLGNLSVVLSFLAHRYRVPRYALIYGAPFPVVGGVILFVMNIGEQGLGSTWGALFWCAAISALGARAAVLHFMRKAP